MHLQYLRNQLVPPGQTELNLFHAAARDGKAEACKAFIDLGVDINIRDMHGETPLHWSAYGGHLETTKVLIEYGKAQVDVTSGHYGRTPLQWALEERRGMNEFDEVIAYLQERETEARNR